MALRVFAWTRYHRIAPSGADSESKYPADQRTSMAAELTDRIREIADARGISESAVLKQAVERGLQKIWEETVLSRYVAGDLDRSEAVERVGDQAIQRTDREVEAVEQDIEWGTKA